MSLSTEPQVFVPVPGRKVPQAADAPGAKPSAPDTLADQLDPLVKALGRAVERSALTIHPASGSQVSD